MPLLVRFYIRHVLIGLLLGAGFTALLVLLDVAHLRHLLLETEAGMVALVMLVLFNGLVFAGVQFAHAVMGLAEEGQGPGGGSRVGVEPVPVACGDGNRSDRAGVNFPRA